MTGAAFYLVAKPPGATSYYTPSDAGDALFSCLQAEHRVDLLAEFVISIWPNRPPPPTGGGCAPGWIIEVRRRGIHAGWICDGRTGGPCTFPPGRQQRLSGTNDWENLTKGHGRVGYERQGSGFDPGARGYERQGRDPS